MDTQTLNDKLELIQWVSALEDESVIEKLMKLRQKETDDLSHLLSNEEKDSIENGLKDADSGNLEPHSNVRKLYEKWL